VQPRDGVHLSADDVRAFLREHLAGYKVPAVVTFHGTLPREDTGKIQAQAARAVLGGARAQGLAPPRARDGRRVRPH
jgi:acyl-CoA synthetase (AMP-forming)/AMP-acid ligase II